MRLAKSAFLSFSRARALKKKIRIFPFLCFKIDSFVDSSREQKFQFSRTNNKHTISSYFISIFSKSQAKRINK